jgi:hypothetical protein
MRFTQPIDPMVRILRQQFRVLVGRYVPAISRQGQDISQYKGSPESNVWETAY